MELSGAICADLGERLRKMESFEFEPIEYRSEYLASKKKKKTNTETASFRNDHPA